MTSRLSFSVDTEERALEQAPREHNEGTEGYEDNTGRQQDKTILRGQSRLREAIAVPAVIVPPSGVHWGDWPDLSRSAEAPELRRRKDAKKLNQHALRPLERRPTDCDPGLPEIAVETGY